MPEEKDYEKTVGQICELLQTDPTPKTIKDLRDAFDELRKQLVAGPFLQVFETTLSRIPFSALFSLLAAPDNKLIVSVAEVTRLLLRPVAWSIIHKTFEEYIVQGLKHPHRDVRYLVLEQFIKYKDKSEPLSVEYGPHIWLCLRGKVENDTTLIAQKVLSNLYNEGVGTEYLFSEKCKSAIATVLSGDELQRFRVYNVMADARLRHYTQLDPFIECGIMDAFMKEGSPDDLLVACNYYETLSALCENRACYSYFAGQGVFVSAFDVFVAAKDPSQEDRTILGIAVIKMFTRLAGSCGIQMETFFKKYPLIRDLGQLVREDGDPMNRLKKVSIACLGAIGYNPLLLIHLAKEKAALDALVSGYKSSVGEMRVCYLQAFSCIFGHPEERTTRESVVVEVEATKCSQICYELYMDLGGGELLAGVTKEIMKGFEDSCVAGLSVLQKLALHVWGVREMANHQNIVNFLLLRNASRSREVQQCQYATVKSFVNAYPAKEAFDEDTYGRLVKYVREGPYFANAVPQVALESSS
ncbi:hypothetical protein GGI07_000512 [Coemansia sp. Benny D115]|nr:hypothetical protein GGI07_000512 [Coemansia sp. Benny D115]